MAPLAALLPTALLLAQRAFSVEERQEAPTPLPVALVFEGPGYLRALAAGPASGTVELVGCTAPSYCADLPQELARRVAAVVGQPKNITAIRSLPNLKLMQSTSYMYPRLNETPSHCTVASYQPDWRNVYGVEPIAEFVIAAVFDWNYRLRERGAAFASCAWGDDAPSRCPPVSALTSHPVLMNQTLGILGYGAIGRAIARRSAALGMRTVATKQHGPFAPPPAPLAWLDNDNDRLLRESDFVAVTVPGSMRDVINRSALGLMKPGAVVIPVSAGPVDFAALHDALQRRAIGGAVLDVWPAGCWHYPDMECGPPYGPAAQPYAAAIQLLDNVLSLPGMAMRDDRFWAGSAEWVGGNLRALVAGLPLRGVVRNATGHVRLRS